MKKWIDFANHLKKYYDTLCIINYEEVDDNVVYCPECGEPIYEDDFPEIEIDDDNCYICPICESCFKF